MVGVEQWAEIRRLHFVRGLSKREISRRTWLARDTVDRAVRSDEPPVYRREPAGSKLDSFKDEIHRLLKGDPKLPGQRIRELIAPLGFEGGKTIVDDYVREVRPLFAPPPRTFQRTVYRPGEICCQFDVREPREEVPVGHGQARQGYVVVAAWATRARAPARWSSPRRSRICWPASGAVCGRWARCPQTAAQVAVVVRQKDAN
jgi:hypothetical protein